MRSPTFRTHNKIKSLKDAENNVLANLNLTNYIQVSDVTFDVKTRITIKLLDIDDTDEMYEVKTFHTYKDNTGSFSSIYNREEIIRFIYSKRKSFNPIYCIKHRDTISLGKGKLYFTPKVEKIDEVDDNYYNDLEKNEQLLIDEYENITGCQFIYRSVNSTGDNNIYFARDFKSNFNFYKDKVMEAIEALEKLEI